MKEIQLTQGKVTLVDDEDFEMLNSFNWYAHKHRSTFYARRNDHSNGRHKNVKMHRLILGITDPNIIIDHRDTNGLNNQRSNLRVCSNSQNQANRPKRKHSVSVYKGVTTGQTKRKETWRAQIKKGDKVIGLGSFNTQEEAAKAYDKAAIEVHGEFANLNFPC
jgi:hypothetical protein